jgi:hypothetical protein
VQWPSLSENRVFSGKRPFQSTNKQKSRRRSYERPNKGNTTTTAAATVVATTNRKKTPKGVKLGDFLPKRNQKKSLHTKSPNRKQVRFVERGTPNHTTTTSVPNQRYKKNREVPDTDSILLTNRFLSLATEVPDNVEYVSTGTAPADSTETPVILNETISYHDRYKNDKSKKKKDNRKGLKVTVTPDQPREIIVKSAEQDYDKTESDKGNRYRPHLNPVRITKWIKEKVHTVLNDEVISSSQGGDLHIENLIKFAIRSAKHFDLLTRTLFELQIWQFYVTLGTKAQHPHWAKEVIKFTKSRDHIKSRQVCENKILKYNEAIQRIKSDISKIALQSGLPPQTDGHDDIMFEYMNQALSKYRKQCEIKVKIAKTERAEFVAWEQFLKLATPTQKTLTALVKAQLLKTREKFIRYEVAAAHATPQVDLLPRNLPPLTLKFRFDETTMSDEQVKDTYDDMNKITRDYRLKATELFIRTVKTELDFHTDKVKQLLEGSDLNVTEQSDIESEASKTFQIFLKAHQFHTAALADRSVLFLEERLEKDAPDPFIPIPVPELLEITGQIQKNVQLNRH